MVIQWVGHFIINNEGFGKHPKYFDKHGTSFREIYNFCNTFEDISSLYITFFCLFLPPKRPYFVQEGFFLFSRSCWWWRTRLCSHFGIRHTSVVKVKGHRNHGKINKLNQEVSTFDIQLMINNYIVVINRCNINCYLYDVS